MSQLLTLLNGDAIAMQKTIPDKSINCCVTSPPYYGLRDYGVAGQIGLEASPEEFIASLIAVFSETWRILRDDGTLWINMGDSYASQAGGYSETHKRGQGRISSRSMEATVKHRNRVPPEGYKPKDLMGMPWRLAFALQAEGWYLRSDIIWHKTNPIPESVTDRPTKSHEYIFLLTKSQKYYYDAESIRESCSESTHARVSQNLAKQEGSHRANGGSKTNGPMRAVVRGSSRKIASESGMQGKRKEDYEAALSLPVENRNKRTVWSVPSFAYYDAHFATCPPDLIKPCIMAGCPVGGMVLDMFGGSGTIGQVAIELGRRATLIELNPDYCALIRQRCTTTPGLAL